MRMTRITIASAAAMLLLCPVLGLAQTQADVKAEVEQIRDQLKSMEVLESRLSELEKKLGGLQTAQSASTPSVSTAFKDSKLKIDGRIFAGVFASQSQGAYKNWSTDIPDAKLRFTFVPSKNIKIVNRFSTSRTQTGDFDYFYADFAGVLAPSNTLRLGQRKIDVGQETWVDNPVENMLISTSVSHVSGYGIGAATIGRFGGPDAAVYELGFVNGPKGVATRPSAGLPVNIKLGKPIGKLFASASYFTTGTLGPADRSAISVAEIAEAPAGATQWRRNLWEADLRYNYGPEGTRPLNPMGKLPPVMLGATYGRFNDRAVGAESRDGSYWFTEGLVRLTPRLYAAARYSVTCLDNGALAKLAKSPVAVNSYSRTSVGLGYALTDLADLKIEYSVNDTSGGASEPGLSQFATGVALKF